MRLPIAPVGGITCLIAAGILGVTRLSFVPYNIRELVVTEYPVFSSFLFACFLTWTFGFPTWVALWFQQSRGKVWSFLGVMLGHGSVAWLFLRYAVPMESIHDIVGSPIFFWPWEFEIIGRFLALYFIVTFTVSSSALLCLAIFFEGKRIVLLKYLAYGITFSSISHFIVFEKAATDNLTELIASGGTLFSSFLLILFLVILTFVSSQLAIFISRINIASKKIVFLSVFISFPAAFLCLYNATENAVLKYGQEFSALQFLLSPDRQHLVNTPELLFRYAIVHASLVVLIALVQVPFWLWISQRASLLISIDTNEA